MVKSKPFCSFFHIFTFSGFIGLYTIFDFLPLYQYFMKLVLVNQSMKRKDMAVRKASMLQIEVQSVGSYKLNHKQLSGHSTCLTST